MLTQLIYASAASAPITQETILQILHASQRRNGLDDITGMLVCDSQSFLQVVEGSRERVSALYARIMRDTRHTDPVLLACMRLEERRFSSWSMGFALADAGNRALFLKHSVSSRFEPRALEPEAALALMAELASRTPAVTVPANA